MAAEHRDVSQQKIIYQIEPIMLLTYDIIMVMEMEEKT